MDAGWERRDAPYTGRREAARGDPPDADQEQLQLAAALRRSEEQVQANEGFQRNMAALAVRANATRDPAVLLAQLCHDAALAFDVPAVTITRLQEPGALIPVASTLPETPLGTAIPLDEAGFLAGRAVRERRAIYRNRLPADLSAVLRPALASALVAPIVAGETVLGTISLAREEPDRFGEDDLVKVTQLAYIAGGALNNAQIYQREREVAQRLRELERWRTGFLHVMAHELRTPLGQVLGFIDLLGDEAIGLSARGQRYLTNVQQAGGVLAAVVQRALDVLDLFAIDAYLAKERINLVMLLSQVLPPYRTRAEAKAAILQVTMPDQAPVLGEGSRLRQAISILLDNALKFVATGGVVAVDVAWGEEGVELAIWDSGPAVPAEVAEQIFSQGLVEDSLTRRHGGTGMSLLLARRIAELHGGSLRLDPSETGARFVLALPAAEPPRGGVP